MIYGNQWQSLLNFYLIISISLQSVLNFYSFLIISIKFLLIDNQYQPERRRREGQQRTPHDPMNSLSVESLEFLEILRLLKFEDIITMVRSHVGSATPPSVMVLYYIIYFILYAHLRSSKFYCVPTCIADMQRERCREEQYPLLRFDEIANPSHGQVITFLLKVKF